MQAKFQQRIDKLRRQIRKTRCSALLVSSYTNVTYLTGFTGDSSYLVVTADDAVLISDTRFTIQLEEECPWLDVYTRSTPESMVDAIQSVVGKMKVTQLGVESDSILLSIYMALVEGLEKLSILPTSGLVEGLREIKDKDEISEIRRAIKMAERVFEVIKASMRPEQTEREIAADIEHQIRKFGGIGCAFAPIVGVGPRAALPHGIPSERRIGDDDFVLIDWGARAGLYVSDLTRILVTGKLSPKLRKVYGVVLKAQQAAIDKIKPGAIMSDVDAAARSVISKAGYGKNFGHGLGHGIGLEVHEMPRLAVKQDVPLKPGMVVTVEPGIYLTDWGGVRIEDDVLVTRTGHEVLSSVTKNLDECLVG